MNLARDARSSCPDDDVLMALVEQRLAPDGLAQLHAHAAACSACAQLLADLVRDSVGEREPSHPGVPLPLSWAPASEFDEFSLVRPLGRGGMGVVYLAYDRSLERQVAIKFIATAGRIHDGTAAQHARFAAEAKAIARLNHPNVVTVFRVGEVDGHPYLVSEYVEGQTLAELARPLPWRQVLGFGLDMARGLGAAHRVGVLHRDIKPSNFLHTQGGTVKLADFGLAELYNVATAAATEARDEPVHIAGTPRYMAPEVLRGQPATVQSELYALGLVLFELCTGELPGRGMPGEPAEAVLDATLSRQGPGIDPDFAALLRACLQRDPLARPASVAAVEQALHKLVPAPPPGGAVAGNPYRGLSPFELEHRGCFFGREQDTAAIVERLQHEPLIILAGDSGIGKSSLCRAGIAAAVTEGALQGGLPYRLKLVWPGRDPIKTLAVALAPHVDRSETDLAARLVEDPAQLARLLRETYRDARIGTGHGLLLVVDQLEELLLVSESEAAQQAAMFLAELALPAPGVRLLLAVRGDLLTKLVALPALGELVAKSLYLLRPLSAAGVRQAVVGPARSRGVVFETEALVETLVAAGREPGALPLLQFALAELWERRDPTRMCIPAAALESLGGVAGILAHHADQVIAPLAASVREEARRVLLRLVTAGNARIERSAEELGMTPLPADASNTAVRAAVDALVQGRLLVATSNGGSTHYQLAHEALLDRWPLLRRWLDEDIGHRAIRQRIEIARAEWQRLGQSNEALLVGQQIEEALGIDQELLGPAELQFVAASRKQRRRQKNRLWSLSIAIVFLVSGGIGVRQWLDNRFIASQLQRATQLLGQARQNQRQLVAGYDTALAFFDGTAPETGEARWKSVLAQRAGVDELYIHAAQSLQTALHRQNHHAGAQSLLAEVTYERLGLAERFHRSEQRAEILRQLQQLPAGQPWLDRLAEPARLTVVSAPPGAALALERYVTQGDGLRVPQAVPLPAGAVSLHTPMADLSLPPGSYRIQLRHGERPPVVLPFLLQRGDRRTIDIDIPAQVPAGYIYVPPGCFLLGSGDDEKLRILFNTVPIHTVCMNRGYLIGRTEVTLGDWIVWLETLPRSASERQIQTDQLELGNYRMRLEQRADGTWTYAFGHPDAPWVVAAAGEPFRYASSGRKTRLEQDWRKFPLAGVAPSTFNKYLGWLDRTQRLPGARFCTEHEWERAARGADDRIYPHGDRLQPDDANIDITYGQTNLGYGPDVAGSHPVSTSPFGVEDLVGNAFELITPASQGPSVPRYLLRGGAWYYDQVTAMVNNRITGSGEDVRDIRIGFRVCAPYPAGK